MSKKNENVLEFNVNFEPMQLANVNLEALRKKLRKIISADDLDILFAKLYEKFIEDKGSRPVTNHLARSLIESIDNEDIRMYLKELYKMLNNEVKYIRIYFRGDDPTIYSIKYANSKILSDPFAIGKQLKTLHDQQIAQRENQLEMPMRFRSRRKVSRKKSVRKSKKSVRKSKKSARKSKKSVRKSKKSARKSKKSVRKTKKSVRKSKKSARKSKKSARKTKKSAKKW